MNIRLKRKVYQKCAECALPKDFIRGFIGLIQFFVAEICEV